MPALAEADPFADLIPETAPEQVSTPAGDDPFADLIPAQPTNLVANGSRIVDQPDFGVFADLVPTGSVSGSASGEAGLEAIGAGIDFGPFKEFVPVPAVETPLTEQALAETLDNQWSELKNIPDYKGRRAPFAMAIAKAIDSFTGFVTGGRVPPVLQGLVEASTEEPKAGDEIIPQVPQQEGTLAQVGAGLANVPIGFANFLLSPEGVATVQGVGLLPKLGQKLVGLGFTTEQVKGFFEAKTPQERVTTGVGAALLGVATLAPRKAPVRPGAEPEAAPVTESRLPVEPTVKAETAAAEPIISTLTGDAADAIRQRSPETEVSRPVSSRENISQDSGRIRPGEQGPEITRAQPEEAATAAGTQEPVSGVASEIFEPHARPEPVGNDWTQATAEPMPVEPSTVPTLRKGEKQGDLLSKQQEDLTLAQETGVDYGARQAEAEAKAAAKAESEAQTGDIFDQPAAEKPRKFRQAAPDGGFTEDPVISFIQGEMGGMMSKSTARRKWGKEKFEANKSLWDAAPHFSDPRQNKVYDARSGQPPDAIATQLAEAGLLPDGSVEALWKYLDRVADREMVRQGKAAEKQAKAEAQEPEWMNPRDDPNWDPSLETHAEKLKLKKNKEGGFVDLDGVAQFGARLFERGIRFAEWAGEMVRHLGAKVREHLKPIWDRLKSAGDERGGIGGKAGQAFGLKISGKRNDLNAATTARSAKLQTSFADAERAQKEIGRVAKTERRQNAMSVFIEAQGDTATLQGWAKAAKGKMFRRAAEDAQTLKPAEIALAQKVRQTFDVLEARGNKYEVLTAHRENYVPHVWDVSKKFTGIGSSKLKDKFKFNKARTFENFFEGDQAGFKPKTLAIGKLLPSYLHEMNSVIADRQFAQDISSGLSTEGTPLVLPTGNAKVVEATEYVVSPVKKFEKSVYDTQAEADAALKPGQVVTPRRAATTVVNPRGFAKAEDAAGNPIDQSGYKRVDQPALSNWRWVSTDAKGNTTILKSELKAHPELARRLNAMMGQSKLRKWYSEDVGGAALIPRAIVKGLDTAQATMKREMFGLLAPFHMVQEGTHGVGHTVNPLFGFEDMSRPTAKHIAAMHDGLMLKPEEASAHRYLEGVGAQSSLISQAARKFGGAAGRMMASIIDGYQHWLFQQYIPALKFKTFEHIVERNMKRYAKDIAKGEVSTADVRMLSAEQANAAYGHLNYGLMDRSPTVQHFLQLGLLAPDFLEARGRFAAQALKPSKAGIEQFRAIAVLAAAQSGTAILLAQLLGEDAEWDPKHPFELVYKNRSYTLRSVPEDMWRLFLSGSDARREFVSARVNPLAQKGWQTVSGRNYRGEKVGFWDTVGETLANYIPITARAIPVVRYLTESGRHYPVSPIEQFAGSIGLKISRYSPITKTYQMAQDYKKSAGLPIDTGVYPVSKYQQLRYALEDADFDRAKTEYLKLKEGGMAPSKIRSGFESSINHPFTATKEGDKKFRESLSGGDRELYDLAVRRRKDILKRFNYATPRH